ncbi:MAG TPA: aldo/keto reductase [Alkalispirochaeta sp.]|nr:aldo/keto reductase [Alkalispirochaeta sp.]
MRYRFLGTTGLRVSQVGLGTMSFGGDADEETSTQLFHQCRDAGVNLFDCADVYQNGRSEEILGTLIRDCRDEVVITSKAYFPIGDGPNDRGASRYHIMRSVEGSLRRLRTDHIDLYYVHRFDDFTAIGDMLTSLDILVRSGKIRYPAVSNFAAWQVEKALGIAERRSLVAPVAIQPMYNLVKRQAEVELLPMAEANTLGVIPYSPLGGGLLSGKYGIKDRPTTGRLIESKMLQARYGGDHVYDVAERFRDRARQWGYHPVSLAIAWVGSHPAVTSPLIGARAPAQLETALQSVEIDLTPAEREQISALSPGPPPATDRNEEYTKYNFGAR